MFTPILTPRLVLRPLALADAAAMFTYRADPDVARYQSWEPATVEEMRTFIASQAGIGPGTPGTWFQVGLASSPLSAYNLTNGAGQAHVGERL